MSLHALQGQHNATAVLQQIITSGRLPSAFLFWGEEGIGKKLAALSVAKALNCQSQRTDACESCASCNKINAGNHPDVRVFPAVDQDDDEEERVESIKIEDIRAIQHYSGLKPFEGRKKVFVIDEAHHLTEEAANAFLKILEEPPNDTLFILVSSKPRNLLATIQSRCQKIKFSPLGSDELKRILQNEYGVDPQASHFLAYYSHGRLGCALRLKDRDIIEQKNKIFDWCISGGADAPDIFEKKSDAEIKELFDIVLAWLRDLYLIKTGVAHAQLINADKISLLLSVMPRVSFEDLDASINYLADASMYVDQNINPKLILANVRLRLWTKLHK